MAGIAVVIPVGPEKHHARWLREAWDSVMGQTRRPETVVLVDDMHGRGLMDEIERWWAANPEVDVVVEEPRWRLGVATAFNWGLAVAFAGGADLAVCLGADDRPEERCIEELEATYDRQGGRDGYYWFEVEYQSGELQALPCNNAALTPGFMRRTGGYPVEASAGAMDSTLISAMLRHDPQSLIKVDGRDRARFWSRQHDHQESKRLLIYGGAAGPIRDAFTAYYRPTSWGRYFDA